VVSSKFGVRPLYKDWALRIQTSRLETTNGGEEITRGGGTEKDLKKKVSTGGKSPAPTSHRFLNEKGRMKVHKTGLREWYYWCWKKKEEGERKKKGAE